jgi:phenylalanyl-tRNA synthetase alpha chain
LRAAGARLIGPSGELTALLKLMKDLPGDRRRELGKRANELKTAIQAAFDARLAQLEQALRRAELSAPPLDVSLPGRGRAAGRLHPLTRVKHELLDVFGAMGFDIADGPEVDLHEHNFDKLGFPEDHPATDMQDTFFVQTPEGGSPERAILLRTHTSTVQVREMLRRKPPLAVVSAGATFRRDDDATHSPMFMQIEGFVVDEGISFAHLKGVLTHFLQRVFGREVPVRFRPSYFPFVEPGGEVDIGCTLCRRWDPEGAAARAAATGAGPAACRVCKDTGFIEVLGCGMIHPIVFEQVGYDAERYTGFAFGMGIDRLTMLRFGVPHLGLLYANDPRFLEQL